MRKVPPSKAAPRSAPSADASGASGASDASGGTGADHGRAAGSAVAAEKAAPWPDSFGVLLRVLGLDADRGRALYTQIARALEGAARSTKRKSAALGKARGLTRHQPAAGLRAEQLIPLILGVRDMLKAGGHGGRPSRAKADRLDRAADAALQGLAAQGRSDASETAGPSSASGAPGELRRDEAELDTTRELLDRLVSMTPDAVLTVRASGRLGLWSVSASRMTGRRRWEAQRRGAAALFREEARSRDSSAELEERGRVASREVTLVNAAGEEVPVRVYGVRLKGPRDEAARDGACAAAAAARRGAADPDRYLLLLTTSPRCSTSAGA